MNTGDRHSHHLEEWQGRDDELDIEIVDLDKLPEHAEPVQEDDAEQGNGKEAAPLMPVRVSLRSRLTQRQRLWRMVVLAAVIIVALVLILNSVIPAHSLIGLLMGPTPTATATLAPNVDHFYLDASPPWGQLYLDGQLLSFSPIEPVQLSRGQHHFVWQAKPFQTVRCTLSVPISAGDTCKHVAVSTPIDGQNSEAEEVTFYDTLNMLPEAQQTTLIQAAQGALNAAQSTTTVQPGERFIDVVGNHTSAIATQPLHATVHFDLLVGNSNLQRLICSNTYSPECLFLYRFASQDTTQNCGWFCTEPGTYSPVTLPNYWQAGVIAYEYWNFTTLDGRPIAIDQPDTELNLTQSAHIILLNIAWDGTRWQAAINLEEESGYNTLACLAADNEFDQIPPPAGIGGFGFAVTPATVPADGCLDVVQTTAANPSASEPASAPQALCLYRFGIMLAVNVLAHRYWPSMALATPYEQKLAERMEPAQSP